MVIKRVFCLLNFLPSFYQSRLAQCLAKLEVLIYLDWTNLLNEFVNPLKTLKTFSNSPCNSLLSCSIVSNRFRFSFKHISRFPFVVLMIFTMLFRISYSGFSSSSSTAISLCCSRGFSITSPDFSASTLQPIVFTLYLKTRSLSDLRSRSCF